MQGNDPDIMSQASHIFRQWKKSAHPGGAFQVLREKINNTHVQCKGAGKYPRIEPREASGVFFLAGIEGFFFQAVKDFFQQLAVETDQIGNQPDQPGLKACDQKNG